MHTNYDTREATILIVDDTPSNLSLISDLLKDSYQVKVATGGLRALEIARASNPPDLILLDVLMPDIDGYAVCRELKRQPATENIPVIFLTARADPVDEEHGLMLGAVDYITKPISPPVVLARIRTQLQLQSYADRLQMLANIHAAELNHARQHYERLLQTTLALSQTTDHQTALDIVLQAGRELLGCDGAAYFVAGSPQTADPDSSVKASVLRLPANRIEGGNNGVFCFYNIRIAPDGSFSPFDSRDIGYAEALVAQSDATLARLCSATKL